MIAIGRHNEFVVGMTKDNYESSNSDSYYRCHKDKIKPIQTAEDKLSDILVNDLIPVFVIEYLLASDKFTITLKG